MKFNEQTIPRFIIAFSALFLLVVLLLSTGITGDTDSITHYLFARYAFKYPTNFLDHWAKPLFTIFSSPFAQLGYTGSIAFNLAAGLLAAWLIYKIARKLLYDYSWAVILMVIFTPVYLINMYTSLTEILFSLVLVAAIYFFLYERFILSVLIISLIPFARTEGLMFLPLFLVALLWMRKYKAIPFLLAGFVVFGLLGINRYGDFFWFINAMPYSERSSELYGSGNFFFYLGNFHRIMGFPLIILAIVGTLTMLKWFVSEKRLLRDVGWATEYLLILPSFFGFILAHSILWWQGMLGVLGSYRFMASVMPLGAFIALAGFNVIINNLSYNRVTRNRIGTLIILSILITPFVYYKIPFVARGSYDAAEQAANWFKQSSFKDRYVYYFDPSVPFYLNADPWDNTRSLQLKPDPDHPEKSYKNGSVIFWENSFGTVEGGLSFNKLLYNPNFQLLNIFAPRRDFTSGSGEYYFMALFEKLPQPVSLKKGFLVYKNFDFEGNTDDDWQKDLTDKSFVSARHSFILKGKDYSPGPVFPLKELPGKESILIRVSGKFNVPKGFPEGEIILVLEARDGKDRMYRYLKAVNDETHPFGKWFEISFMTGINKFGIEDGIIMLYAWNRSRYPVMVDDLKIEYFPGLE
jgi:hypothetical protein